MYRVEDDGFSFTTAPYWAGVTGWPDATESSTTFADLYEGESIPAANRLGPRTLNVKVGIRNQGTLNDKWAAIDALKVAVEAGVPQKRVHKLTIQRTSDAPAIYFYAVPSAAVPTDGTLSEWVIRYDAQSNGYSEVETTASLPHQPTANLLANPTLSAYVGGTEPFTSWTSVGGDTGAATRAWTGSVLGRYSADLDPATYTTAFVRRLQQSVSGLVVGNWYALAAWFAVRNDPNAVGAPVIMGAGAELTTRVMQGPIERLGYTWTRYTANFQATATSHVVEFGWRGARGYVDGSLQMEQVASGTANPGAFNDPGSLSTWAVVQTTGTAPSDLELDITPASAPVGRWKYRIGPLKVDSPANIGYGGPYSVTLTGASAEVTAGNLQADGNDLNVVTMSGNVVTGGFARWIADTTAADWKVWFIGLPVKDTPRYVYIVYGNPDALDPARYGPPENVAVQPYKQPSISSVPPAGITYFYRVACDSITGETLASAAVSITTDGESAPVLRWDVQPNANRYHVYRATVDSEQSYRRIATVFGTRLPDYNRATTTERPRLTGSNPTSPYDLRKPLWSLTASDNRSLVYTQLEDIASRSRPGSWQAERLWADLWLTATGIQRVRTTASTITGDSWRMESPFDIERVTGQWQLQQDPRYYRFGMTGVDTSGATQFLYTADAPMEPPDFHASRDTSGTGLPAGTYSVRVTAANATGETNSTRVAVKLTANERIQVVIPAAPDNASGTVTYRVYCSTQYDPLQAMSFITLTNATADANGVITPTAYPVTAVVAAAGTGKTAPADNQSRTIYPALTTPAAFDTGVLATPVRTIRARMRQVAARAVQQQAKLVNLTLQRAAAQAPTVATAAAASKVEMPHLELLIEHVNTGDRMRLDLIDVDAGQTVTVDGEHRTISKDGQGYGQADAVHLDEARSYWLRLLPGEPNILRYRTYQRAGAVTPPVTITARARGRWG